MKRDVTYKKALLYFLLSFLVMISLSLLILVKFENDLRTTRIDELKRQEQRVVNLENDFLGREFSLVLSDLHYLHHAFENQLLERKQFPEVSAHWIEFSTQRRIYDQIRYIDVNGDERIRINIEENGAYAVSNENLQNKKDRYYFTETVKLEEESVYVSPLDLNMEHGVIETPHKPMIRLSTPVYDDKGNLQGIIVLNYLAEYMLSSFRDLGNNSQGEVVLVNENGYRLSSENPENDWNFMFEEKKGKTFIKEFPEEWSSILENREQFQTKGGFITASPVELDKKYMDGNMLNTSNLVLGDGNWYIVSIVEKNEKNGEYFNDSIGKMFMYVLEKNRTYFVLVTILSCAVGFIIYLNRKTYLQIKYYSEFDPLTKAWNRRAGLERIHQLYPTDERRHYLISLCFVDINGLKEVNDTLGHKQGDELIKTVATTIKEAIREDDFLIRLGGDEFLIVFNSIDLKTAEKIWGRIVQSHEQINLNETRPYIISASHGIVDFDNNQNTHLDDLINAADQRMYQEKQVIKANFSVIKESM